MSLISVQNNNNNMNEMNTGDSLLLFSVNMLTAVWTGINENFSLLNIVVAALTITPMLLNGFSNILKSMTNVRESWTELITKLKIKKERKHEIK
jgi:hypothetical protein